MSPSELNRRDFNRLTSAALSGLIAGVAVGCGKTEPAPGVEASTPKPGETKPPTALAENSDAAKPSVEQVAMLEGDVHICRGLNACHGKGVGHDNACAGQGACSTAKAHSCHKENECKGQGGCGESYGVNACKAQGECAVPLGDPIWKKARKRFEEQMTKQGKKLGDPPPKP
jgi:hypothetical protein